MISNKPSDPDSPIDAVIAWVDGDDPVLKDKRNKYLHGGNVTIGSGAHPTRFASSNEIRYCVLSILKFAPFVRNIFIVTDEQDPGISADVKKYFPDRSGSVRIVDHKEIFRGFENYLPTFNSISIAHMIWRIKGLSENFVYFNDDTFLVREIKPGDWFLNDRPVLRGRWVPAPVPRSVWNRIRIFIKRQLLGRKEYEPRASFHMGQWNSAFLLGFRFRYFTNSHTPHPVSRKPVEDFFSKNRLLIEKNISFRFRENSQFTFISLSNHLQLIEGNRNIAGAALVYLKPEGRAAGYVKTKLARCAEDHSAIYMCIQGLEMCSQEDRDMLFGWLDRRLGL
ncbi:capsular biosynthesis protein [bacterium]|nr:capsular biosynthesis protein [bacterium]